MVTTISPELLRQRLRNEPDTQLLDVRPAEDYDSWHVPGSVNIPFALGDTLDMDRFVEETEFDLDDELVVICAEGKSSRAIADALEDHGAENVAVVQDGMIGWSQLYELTAIPTVAPALEIFQVQRVAKGCLGYVIGDPHTGRVAVVDPTRHLDEFRRVAGDNDMEITRVIDTHIHADHISGGRRLADDVDAAYHLPVGAADRDITLAFDPLEPNEVLSVGDIEIKAIHTPGHTAEAMSLLVGTDAILTGDTLLTNGVGRTELQFDGDSAATGAEALYESVHRSILTLPDGLTVLPGHFSAEEEREFRTVGEPIRTTVRALRTEVPILQASKSDFVERLSTDPPRKPPNYDRVIRINTGREMPADEEDAANLELGPNRCAAAAD